MRKDERSLKLLLRIVGVTTLFALPAVFMPKSWMASTRVLGLGELQPLPLCRI